MSEARAKPLNAITRAALHRGVEAWDDEIEYLEDSLKTAASAVLRERSAAKLVSLRRAREWVQSKLESVEDGHAS